MRLYNSLIYEIWTKDGGKNSINCLFGLLRKNKICCISPPYVNVIPRCLESSVFPSLHYSLCIVPSSGLPSKIEWLALTIVLSEVCFRRHSNFFGRKFWFLMRSFARQIAFPSTYLGLIDLEKESKEDKKRYRPRFFRAIVMINGFATAQCPKGCTKVSASTFSGNNMNLLFLRSWNLARWIADLSFLAIEEPRKNLGVLCLGIWTSEITLELCLSPIKNDPPGCEHHHGQEIFPIVKICGYGL